jgi:tetratricopeptide (TPR) repeat protein
MKNLMLRLHRTLAPAALLLVATPMLDAQEEELGMAEIRFLLDSGSSPSEIVSVLEESSLVDILDAELVRLEELGAHAAVVQAIEEAIRRNPTGIILRMQGDGSSEQEIIDWILLNIPPVELGAKDKLRLFRAGFSGQIQDAIAGRYTLPGFVPYEDSFGFMSLQHPAEWLTYEFYEAGGLYVILSPERGIEGSNEFTTGVQIQFSYWGGDAPEDPLAFHEHQQASFLAQNRGEFNVELIPGEAGRARLTGLSGVPATKQAVTVDMQGVPCMEYMLRAFDDEVMFFIEAIAPRDEFADLSPVYDQMLKTCRIFPKRPNIVRRKSPMSPERVLREYKESVVMVTSHFGEGKVGYGTGFFVREDGMLLTNHHVICGKDQHMDCHTREDMQLAESYELTWDSTVGPKRPGARHRTARAALIDTVYVEKPTVDLALLRAERSTDPYKATLLDRVGSGSTRIGDPVVALGFPLPNRMGIGNIFQTEGTIASISYVDMPLGQMGDEERSLDGLMTSAEINPGNSGGPCIDLYTGAVVGLNTFVPLDGGGEIVDYAGVSIVDHALYHFPQIRWYPSAGRMTAEQHLELAQNMLAQGNSRAAGVELVAASQELYELDPVQRAIFFYSCADYHNSLGDWDAYEENVLLALAEDGTHRNALIEAAQLAVGDGDSARAIALFDRLIEGDSGDYYRYYRRGSFYRGLGQLERARADVERALELGGCGDPQVHVMYGRICLDERLPDDARACFERAMDLAPSDIEAHFGLADCYLYEGELEAARLELARFYQRNLGDPAVASRYGHYLAKELDRAEDAIEILNTALALSVSREGRLDDDDAFTLLKTLESLSLPIEDTRMGLIVPVANLLYESYPAKRPSVHTWYARHWELSGSPSLARSHYLAGGFEDRAGSLDFAPLQPGEVVALIAHGYPADAFAEVVACGKLGFSVNATTLKQLGHALGAQLHWAYVQALTLQSVFDQLEPSAELGSAIKIRLVDDFVKFSEHSLHGLYELTNNCSAPLGGITLRYTFLNKDGDVLAFVDRHEAALLMAPGEDRRLELRYPSWDELARQGAQRQDVKKCRVEVVSARAADCLSQLAAKAVRYSEKGLEIEIANSSPVFSVEQPVVRIEFFDEYGKPLRHPSGDRNLSDTRTFMDCDVLPGARLELTCKEWSDPAYLASLGLPNLDAYTCTLRVVGGQVALALPQGDENGENVAWSR